MRRQFVAGGAWIVLFFALIGPVHLRAADAPVQWLDKNAPAVPQGVSWGVPWAKGTVSKDQKFVLKSADGKQLPLQSWPMAYWQDGSIKWSGFATVAGPDSGAQFIVSPSADTYQPQQAVRVTTSDTTYLVDTGKLQARISKSGMNIIDSMVIEGREVARQGQLVCILQDGLDSQDDASPKREKYLGKVEKVTMEQSGPVRAVFKIEGRHLGGQSKREWLPFVVRMYFFAGETSVRMAHTIVFDGDQSKDFIRGLGVNFAVPMREEIHNRHVRFGGEAAGVWAEPIQPLSGWNQGVSLPAPPSTQPNADQPAARGRGGRGGRSAYPDQLAGRRIPDREALNQASQESLTHYPVWGDFRLIQPNAEGFTIEKRTTAQSAWIPAASGKRSSGLAFVGDVSGGLAIGLKDFWQAYPTSLEIRNARSEAAEVRVWLWSPDAPAMDLRHYDTVARPLAFTYEDAEPDLSTSTPYGVARTHELTLFPCASIPTRQETSGQAQSASRTPLLVCTPKYLHDQQAFGIWSLADRSTPLKQKVEDYLDSIISYYQKSIDQHNWYGFWDYGDVMHSYDSARHEWKYDVGGFAWDNSEQGTDMVFWYLFLRSGRADIFRMAEAMTRHTGEVDCYHMGKLAGLGSRHNIRHWGCGAKEARISMAPYRRFYYYLTTDERTGDVMREMLAADVGVTIIDPMRKVMEPTAEDAKYPARVRAGPDWFALVGNWMTEWERTGDTKWRDKIYTGMDSIATFPHKINTSQNLLWYLYPDTGKLLPRDTSQGGYNLVNQMGGPEIIFELNEMIDHPTWKETWLEYCRARNGGRFAAYMYRVTKDPQWADRVTGGVGGGSVNERFTQLTKVDGPESVKPLVEGPDGLVTNGINQTTLELLQIMDMVNDRLPQNAPAPGLGGRGRGGRGVPAGAAPETPAN